MRVFCEGVNYTECVEDMDYYIMDMELNGDIKDNKRRLGLSITRRGPQVKEVYIYAEKKHAKS